MPRCRLLAHDHSPYRHPRATVRNADHREITSAVVKASHHISIFLRERYDAYEPAYMYIAIYITPNV